MKLWWILALGLALAAVVFPSVSLAVTVEEVAKELMDPCVNCKGKLLASCDCGPAAELKTEIQGMIDGGADEKAIVSRVVAEHGEWIRAAPEKKGFNLLGWVFPFVLIAAGGFGIFAYLRRAVARDASRPGPLRAAGEERTVEAPERDDDYYRRALERELRAGEK